MSIVSNIFDPRHYEAVRRPLLEASTLPAWCYTLEAFYQREVEEIFMKTWHLVGREDEVPDLGDYLIHDMCDESATIIRGNDGKVRAFANTCRHRSTRLMDGAGQCRAIICPYHAWTYDRQGTLVRMRGMEKTLDFDKAHYNLLPVRLQSGATRGCSAFPTYSLSDRPTGQGYVLLRWCTRRASLGARKTACGGYNRSRTPPIV